MIDIQPHESGKKVQHNVSLVPYFIGTYLVVALIGIALIAGCLWLGSSIEKSRADSAARIRATCAPIDTFVVREQYRTGYKHREIRYRLMNYERFRCGEFVETLRTYVSEDVSIGTNLPTSVPELPAVPEEPLSLRDSVVLRSIDSGLSPLLGSSFRRKVTDATPH